jgi:hypothetical protein
MGPFLYDEVNAILKEFGKTRACAPARGRGQGNQTRRWFQSAQVGSGAGACVDESVWPEARFAHDKQPPNAPFVSAFCLWPQSRSASQGYSDRLLEGSSPHIGGSLSIVSASVVLMRYQGVMKKSSMSAYLHSECPIKSDHFAIQHLIFDDVSGKRCIFVWSAQARWKGHLLPQGKARGFG